MKGSYFIFDSVNLFYYKCHKININRCRSYRDFPDWMKTIKATINPINGDDTCFQYAATITLNHEEIGKNSKRISKIKHIINKCNWKGINYPSGKDYRKKLRKKIQQLFLMYFMWKKWIYIPPIFQNSTQIIKIKSFF